MVKDLDFKNQIEGDSTSTYTTYLLHDVASFSGSLSSSSYSVVKIELGTETNSRSSE